MKSSSVFTGSAFVSASISAACRLCSSAAASLRRNDVMTSSRSGMVTVKCRGATPLSPFCQASAVRFDSRTRPFVNHTSELGRERAVACRAFKLEILGLQIIPICVGFRIAIWGPMSRPTTPITRSGSLGGGLGLRSHLLRRHSSFNHGDLDLLLRGHSGFFFESGGVKVVADTHESVLPGDRRLKAVHPSPRLGFPWTSMILSLSFIALPWEIPVSRFQV
jgi:hypothetical protein